MVRALKESFGLSVSRSWLAIAWLALPAAWGGDPKPSESSSTLAHRVPGLAAPRRTVTLAATRPGKIAELSVEEGAAVRKGQKVFQLDDRVQRARTEIAQAQAQSTLEVDIARTIWDQSIFHLDRIRQIDNDRSATSKELTDASATTTTRELEYHQAEFEQQQQQRLLELEKALLDEFAGYAPFDGVVLTRVKETGESVNELDPIVTLAQVDPIQITVDVPLKMARGIPAGQAIEIEWGDGQVQRRTARVEIKSPAADPAGQTLRIKLEVENPDRAIVPGSKVFVLITDATVGAAAEVLSSVPDTTTTTQAP